MQFVPGGNMVHDEKFFMCPPGYYDIEYVINPWMKGNLGGVDRGEAAREWDGLYRVLSNHAKVETIESARRIRLFLRLVCIQEFQP